MRPTFACIGRMAKCSISTWSAASQVSEVLTKLPISLSRAASMARRKNVFSAERLILLAQQIAIAVSGRIVMSGSALLYCEYCEWWRNGEEK